MQNSLITAYAQTITGKLITVTLTLVNSTGTYTAIYSFDSQQVNSHLIFAQIRVPSGYAGNGARLKHPVMSRVFV